MNKEQLIRKIAEQTNVSIKVTDEVVKAFMDVVGNTVASGEAVQLIGFGTFTGTIREPRIGRNPKTQEPIEIAGSTLPTFKAGKPFKELVNTANNWKKE